MALLECLATDVKLPDGMKEDDLKTDRTTFTKELIELGTTSPAAATAGRILADLHGRLPDSLTDDKPIVHPLRNRIARSEEALNQFKSEQKAPSGLESASDKEAADAIEHLEAVLEKLRGEER